MGGPVHKFHIPDPGLFTVAQRMAVDALARFDWRPVFLEMRGREIGKMDFTIVLEPTEVRAHRQRIRVLRNGVTIYAVPGWGVRKSAK